MMRNWLRNVLATLVLSILSGFSGYAVMAQDTTDAVTTARAQSQDLSHDFMTAHGKIAVVMVVCLTILAGLILYIVRLDRKLSRLEKMGRK